MLWDPGLRRAYSNILVFHLVVEVPMMLHPASNLSKCWTNSQCAGKFAKHRGGQSCPINHSLLGQGAESDGKFAIHQFPLLLDCIGVRA